MSPLDLAVTLRRSLAGNRARLVLTLLGVIIGSASIVMLAGLLKGGEEALVKLNQGVHGSDLIRVGREEPPDKDLSRPTRELSRFDEAALASSRALSGSEVVSESSREVQGVWAGRQKRLRLTGVSERAPPLFRLAAGRGRLLTSEDVAERRRVCVLGFEVWEELFEREEDLSKLRLSADGATWVVVGVLAHKPTLEKGDGTWMWDRRVMVPQTSFDAAYDPSHRVKSIIVRSPGASRAGLTALGSLVEGTLLRRHLGVKNFKLQGQQEGRGEEEMILFIVKALLLCTGLLSLVVGGINIMNIMLVSVSERTREIGLRRAVGATPGAILGQFLAEACTLSGVGGALGVGGGIAVSWLLALALSQAFGGWQFHVEGWSVLLALGLALLTGIGFGLMPAWRASRLLPVDALRAE